jgi:hypothetical protein
MVRRVMVWLLCRLCSSKRVSPFFFFGNWTVMYSGKAVYQHYNGEVGGWVMYL